MNELLERMARAQEAMLALLEKAVNPLQTMAVVTEKLDHLSQSPGAVCRLCGSVFQGYDKPGCRCPQCGVALEVSSAVTVSMYIPLSSLGLTPHGMGRVQACNLDTGGAAERTLYIAGYLRTVVEGLNEKDQLLLLSLPHSLLIDVES